MALCKHALTPRQLELLFADSKHVPSPHACVRLIDDFGQVVNFMEHYLSGLA